MQGYPLWATRELANATHRSVTEGKCRFCRRGRGKEAELSYLGHALMEGPGTRGLARVDGQCILALAASDLICLPKLMGAAK